MAKNTGHNHRKGSVKSRTQLTHPSSSKHSIKRNATTGRFMNVTDGKFKGVAKEIDKRRT